MPVSNHQATDSKKIKNQKLHMLRMELLQEFTWLVRVSGAIFSDDYKGEITKIITVFCSHL